MKNNVKRLAALMMVLALLFAVSATAFASTVYSNIITIDVEEPVVEEPVVEEPVVEEPVVEEPVVEEPVVEEPVVEEPVVEEPVVEEPVVEEPVVEEPTPEELLANVVVSVKCSISSQGALPAFGDIVTLKAVVEGAEDLEYKLVWEFRSNASSEWQVYEGCDLPEFSFPLTAENCLSEWRARVMLVTKDSAPVDEAADIVEENGDLDSFSESLANE